MKIISRNGDAGVAETSGVRREIALILLPDANVGDYVIVHAGFAMQKIDEEEAHRTLDLLGQMSDSEEILLGD